MVGHVLGLPVHPCCVLAKSKPLWKLSSTSQEFGEASSGLCQASDLLSWSLQASEWPAEGLESHFLVLETNQKWLSKASLGHSETHRSQESGSLAHCSSKTFPIQTCDPVLLSIRLNTFSLSSRKGNILPLSGFGNLETKACLK